MFHVHGIILHIQKIRDKQFRYIIFSREYGRIHCWYKKDGGADIGNLVHMLMERKGMTNTISTIDIVSSITDTFSTYTEVFTYLHFLESMSQILPEGIENKSIYDDMYSTVTYISINGRENSQKNIQIIKLLLVRIFKKLGFLKKEAFGSESILKYIYTHIDTKHIHSICTGKNIEALILKSIDHIIQDSYHTFIYSP